MNNPDPVLENILQAERLKMNSLVRALTFIRLERTSEYARGKADVTGLQYKEFKPSLMTKLLFFIVPLFIFAVAISFFQIPKESRNSAIIGLIFMAIIQIIVVSIIYYANRGKAYTIRMDYDGLTVGEKNYRWMDIYDTAILIRGNGKNRRDFLVVAHKDMLNYDLYTLQNFTSFSFIGFSKRLARNIEAFKRGGR